MTVIGWVVPALGLAVVFGWLTFLAYAMARLLVEIARSMRGRK